MKNNESMHVRMPTKMLKSVERLARKYRRSRSEMFRILVEAALLRETRKK